ncbi:unnamed protein product [Moneuplotes crassus]|uniref:Uncharacterized protein n=1 Tax=Euplotes crassus TaxID=5936 RepID=A0AAD1X462_EUPCR|nr:unnamed protein product [Moneuplotes crassus]
MNSKIILNRPSQDILLFSDLSFIDAEPSPQIPNSSVKFTNTLRLNKGRANRADFRSSSITKNPNATTKPLHCHFQRKPKKKLKDYKPMTYDPKICATWRVLSLPKTSKEGLRSIPSSEILKILLI